MSVRALRRGSIAASRVTAPATVNTLSLPATVNNYVSTPDSAANSPTAAIDLRMKCSMVDWTPSASKGLAAKLESAGSQSSWQWFVTTGGSLRIGISENGSSLSSAVSASALGFTDGTTHWVRTTWEAATDLARFYKSDDTTNDPAAVSWTEIGSGEALGPLGAMANTTSLLVLGMSRSDNMAAEVPLTGNIYVFEMRSTVGGTVVQKFDATAVTKIGTRNPNTVAAGGPWTLNGSAWDWANA